MRKSASATARVTSIGRARVSGFAHVNAVAPIGVDAADCGDTTRFTGELLLFFLSVVRGDCRAQRRRVISSVAAARSTQLIQKRRAGCA